MSTWVIMPSDDDIEHSFHKYIDKIRTASGKWRYIYEDTSRKARHKVNSIVGTYEKKKLNKAKRTTEFEKRNHELSRENTRSYAGYLNQYGKPRDEELERLTEFNAWNVERLENAKADQKKAQEAYNKTLLGKIDQVKDAGLKAWDSFTSLFKKESPDSRTVTNNSRSKDSLDTSNKYQYTPSYSTKKKKRRRA